MFWGIWFFAPKSCRCYWWLLAPNVIIWDILVNVKHCVLALLKKPKSISKNGSFQEILIRSLFLISNALLFCLICAPGSVWIKRSAWGTFTERSKKEVSLSWLNASDKWVCNKMTLFHKLLQKTIDMLSFEQCPLKVELQKECKYCCRCITSFWIIHARDSIK